MAQILYPLVTGREIRFAKDNVVDLNGLFGHFWWVFASPFINFKSSRCSIWSLSLLASSAIHGGREKEQMDALLRAQITDGCNTEQVHVMSLRMQWTHHRSIGTNDNGLVPSLNDCFFWLFWLDWITQNWTWCTSFGHQDPRHGFDRWQRHRLSCCGHLNFWISMFIRVCWTGSHWIGFGVSDSDTETHWRHGWARTDDGSAAGSVVDSCYLVGIFACWRVGWSLTMLFPQDQWAYSCKPLAASMDEKGCLLHFAPGNGFFSALHLARIFHGHFVACQVLLPGGQQPSLLELSEQLELHSNMTWTPKSRQYDENGVDLDPPSRLVDTSYLSGYWYDLDPPNNIRIEHIVPAHGVFAAVAVALKVGPSENSHDGGSLLSFRAHWPPAKDPVFAVWVYCLSLVVAERWKCQISECLAIKNSMFMWLEIDLTLINSDCNRIRLTLIDLHWVFDS